MNQTLVVVDTQITSALSSCQGEKRKKKKPTLLKRYCICTNIAIPHRAALTLACIRSDSPLLSLD